MYTSHSYGCGIDSELIFVKSKVLKLAHSWLCNYFSNTVIGTKLAARNPQLWLCEVYMQITTISEAKANQLVSFDKNSTGNQ